MSSLKSVKCLWINYKDMLDALHQKCISHCLIAARKEGMNYISQCIQTKRGGKNQRMSPISVGNGAVINGASNTIKCSLQYKWRFTNRKQTINKLQYKPQLQHLWKKNGGKKRKKLIGWLVDEVEGLDIVGLWEEHSGGWWAVIG